MAMERLGRGPDVAEDDREARVGAVVSRHLPALLRVARRVSLCADDAQDAVQRALEIYVRRLDGVDTSTEVAWLKVVVRHEALAIRRARAESVASEEVDFDAHAGGDRGVDDAVAGSERVRRSAEALRALKPDEATALLLKAQGHSYAEIGERQGWSYTKVNAVCLGGAGAGTYCVVTDTLPSPSAIVRPADPDRDRARDRARPRRARSAPRSAATSTPPATALRAATAMTPTPTATPGPRRTVKPTPTPRPRTTPPPATSSQTAAAQDEFGFEGGGSNATATSPAPATASTTAGAGTATPRKRQPARSGEFGFE
jgi:RNA polymerase sigma factor (sigma-70 family)